jgi:hypothetical protein
VDHDRPLGEPGHRGRAVAAEVDAEALEQRPVERARDIEDVLAGEALDGRAQQPGGRVVRAHDDAPLVEEQDADRRVREHVRGRGVERGRRHQWTPTRVVVVWVAPLEPAATSVARLGGSPARWTAFRGGYARPAKGSSSSAWRSRT